MSTHTLIVFEWIFNVESEFRHTLSINCHFCIPFSMHYNYNLTMSSCILKMTLTVIHRKAYNYSPLLHLQPHSFVSTTVSEVSHPSLANKILKCFSVLFQPWFKSPSLQWWILSIEIQSPKQGISSIIR